MVRFLSSGFVALALVAGASAPVAGAAVTRDAPSPVIPGAAYRSKGTLLVVDAAGRTVSVEELPVHAKCKGRAPGNEGDYGDPGLGPFTIAADGSFANVAKGATPGKTQTVIKGKFAGTKVSGSVVQPAFDDKGFHCARFSGTWKATREAGTGDATKAGATYAADDFSDSASGFDTFNEDSVYAEYLPDGRFRIGTRASALVAALRADPVTATVDLSVQVTAVTASGADGAGLACDATSATSYIVGYVGQDGNAHISRYVKGDEYEATDPIPVPAGLLQTDEGVANTVRMTCAPGDKADTTAVHLFVNGTDVAHATASALAAGTTGVMVNSDTGSAQFLFDDFSAKKPA